MLEVRVSVGHLLRAAARRGNAEMALHAERSGGTPESVAAAQEELDNAKEMLNSLHELLAKESTLLVLPDLRRRI